jgi:signal peptidase I
MSSSTPRRLATAMAALVAVLSLAGAGLVLSGRNALVVTDGVSMQPVYYQGDLVVLSRQKSYSTGEIVAYRRPGKAQVVLHRIVGGDARGFVFKGDNNQSIDPTRPRESDLVGRAVLHIPQGGLWMHRVMSPPALAVLAFLLLVVSRRKVTRRRGGRSARHAAASSPALPLGPLSPALRIASGATAFVAVVGVVLGGLAWTRPLEVATAVAAPSAPTMTWSYSAAVGHTPAYDSTTVTSPDPVFRRVARLVTVDYAYRGATGALAFTVELGSPGGWHVTLPVQPRSLTPVSGRVRLDLAALEARVRAASSATGLPLSPVRVAVVGRVQPAGQALFEPALTMELSPLQLSLTSGAASLVVRGAPVAGRPVTSAAVVPLAGQHASVAWLRGASGLLLLAALLVAGVVLLVVRRTSPADEDSVLRRRYASRLVGVEPAVDTAVPSSRPVIDVLTFETLARIADRHEALIMHWTSGGVETFVVQEETGTYRYRSGYAGRAAAEV